MTIHDAIDYDFADLRLPLNDGFPTGYFFGTATIDSDGCISGITFSKKQDDGSFKYKTICVPPPHLRTGAFDETIAVLLSEELCRTQQWDIDEQLDEWRRSKKEPAE